MTDSKIDWPFNRYITCLLYTSDLERDCFLIDFSVSTRAIDLMAKRKAERLKRIGITVMQTYESSGIPGTSEIPASSAGVFSDGQAHTDVYKRQGIRQTPKARDSNYKSIGRGAYSQR